MSDDHSRPPRRVLITGGLGGIGYACAECFADAGDHVIVTSRRADRIARLSPAARASGGRIEGVVSALETPGDIDALLAEIGPPDVLINNAGRNAPAPFLDVDLADFDAILSVNVRSLFMLTQAVCRVWVEAGHGGIVVNISSQAGAVGLPERSAYCASKHAVEGLTKAIAVDLKGHGIRINNLAPTFVETDMTQKTLARADFAAHIENKLLLDRLPSLAEVARAAYFLGSPQSAGITGTCLKIDAGWTAH